MKSFYLASSTFMWMAISLIFLLVPDACAQSSNHPIGTLRLGFGANYSDLRFGQMVASLNEIWRAAPGYQVQVLAERPLHSRISILTGLEFHVNRYRFQEQSIVATNPSGEPTGEVYTQRLENTVGVYYLAVPLHIHAYPLKSQSMYLTVGPELALKIGYRNSRFQTTSNHLTDIPMYETYDIPERSRDRMWFASAGIGYRSTSVRYPIDVELKIRHSITTFMDDDSFANQWIRSGIVALRYRF